LKQNELVFFSCFKLSNGSVQFSKQLVLLNDEFALTQKLNLLFSDANETMYRESIA